VFFRERRLAADLLAVKRVVEVVCNWICMCVYMYIYIMYIYIYIYIYMIVRGVEVDGLGLKFSRR